MSAFATAVEAALPETGAVPDSFFLGLSCILTVYSRRLLHLHNHHLCCLLHLQIHLHGNLSFFCIFMLVLTLWYTRPSFFCIFGNCSYSLDFQIVLGSRLADSFCIDKTFA